MALTLLWLNITINIPRYVKKITIIDTVKGLVENTQAIIVKKLYCYQLCIIMGHKRNIFRQ